jgi:V8-like Glu-specific endopeptidase
VLGGRAVNVSTLAAVATIAAVMTGCAAHRIHPKVDPAANPADDSELFGPTQTPAVAVAEDAIVRVVGPQMTCSGVLIADDRVLTAHHCVVERGARGEFSSKVIPAKQMKIELGGDWLPWGEVGARAIVTPPCGESGGRGDVAVIVLERHLVGLATMTPRLEKAPARGEVIEPAGFGRCAASPAGIRRRHRESGPIHTIQSWTFEVNAAICPGDSGGPVIARGSNDVVGIVSSSAMDHDESTRALSVMARIDAFRGVFVYAKTISDGADPSDLPPLACEQ